ncbi:uncharacterized protein LOC100207622 [Hydra vulgaris]|uniref:uncharacterized protein LOC100207622 n=1 Tax=Hydra vulgaris TaxID=6087 RepID=UPI0006412A2F|nr:uncharacterized protein LOC100207622 [Hydra vulgaris]
MASKNNQKSLLMFSFFIRMFFCGVEYSVILPSVIPYMKSLHSSNLKIGIAVGIYPFASMFALPVFGFLYDKTKRLKEIMLLQNFFQISGNLLYALHYSEYFPIAGRFVAGLGDGFSACAIGEMTAIYSNSKRVGMMSIIESGRVFGLIIGPALNVFISNHSFVIDHWILDYKTLPGVSMAFGWFLMSLITIFCVTNISLRESEAVKYLSLSEIKQEENESAVDYPNHNYDFLQQEDIFEPQNTTYITDNSLKKKHSIKEYWLSAKNSILSLEFLVIFYTDFILWFIQTQFEILLPYITEIEYGWTPIQTSGIYIGGGILLLVIFFLIFILSPKYPVHDVKLLLFSMFLTQVSLLLVIFESVPKLMYQKVIIFSIICLLVFTSIPFNLVCSRNLFTRMFPEKNQGIIQGVYSSASRFSMIGGPILISLVFGHRKLYGAIASVSCLFGIVLLLCSTNRIKKKEQDMIARMKERISND